MGIKLNDMTPEQENIYLQIIEDDFKGMKNMLDHIYTLIAEYPTMKQLEFIAPLKNMIFEAWQDARNPNDPFLNSYSEPIKVEP